MKSSRKTVPSAVVGIDVGTDTIKVAEAKYGKDGVTITALGVAPTPPGAIDSEIIIDPVALGAAIKSLLSEVGIKTKKTVSSVGGQSRVVVRVIPVPKMSEQELAETMTWEVERHVPFSPTEVVMDFHAIDLGMDDPNVQEMEVFLAVAQQDLIQGHVDMLQSAGLQPIAIDVESLAVGRSVIGGESQGAGGHIYGIIDIGNSKTEFGIFENGMLTFPSPPFGIAGAALTREISEAMSETLEEAELTKKNYAKVDMSGFAGAGAPADDFGYEGGQTAYDVSYGATDGDFATGETVEAADLGDFGAAEPAGADFDLGGDVSQDFEQTQQFDGAPGFDLGGEEPVAAGGAENMFDLGDENPADSAEADAGDLQFDSPFDLGFGEPEPVAGEGDAAADDFYGSAHSASDPGAAAIESQVFQAIGHVLVDIAGELRKSVEYYNVRYQKMPEKIYLCGGSGKIPNLDKYLENELGIPVEKGDPLRFVNVSAPQMSEHAIREVAPMFGVAIGLAIRDMID